MKPSKTNHNHPDSNNNGGCAANVLPLGPSEHGSKNPSLLAPAALTLASAPGQIVQPREMVPLFTLSSSKNHPCLVQVSDPSDMEMEEASSTSKCLPGSPHTVQRRSSSDSINTLVGMSEKSTLLPHLASSATRSTLQDTTKQSTNAKRPSLLAAMRSVSSSSTATTKTTSTLKTVTSSSSRSSSSSTTTTYRPLLTNDDSVFEWFRNGSDYDQTPQSSWVDRSSGAQAEDWEGEKRGLSRLNQRQQPGAPRNPHSILPTCVRSTACGNDRSSDEDARHPANVTDWQASQGEAHVQLWEHTFPTSTSASTHRSDITHNSSQVASPALESLRRFNIAPSTRPSRPKVVSSNPIPIPRSTNPTKGDNKFAPPPPPPHPPHLPLLNAPSQQQLTLSNWRRTPSPPALGEQELSLNSSLVASTLTYDESSSANSSQDSFVSFPSPEYFESTGEEEEGKEEDRDQEEEEEEKKAAKKSSF